MGKLELVLIAFRFKIVVQDERVVLAALLAFLDALDAEFLQLGLEVVEHDGVGEAFEDEGELPPWVDADVKRLA